MKKVSTQKPPTLFRIVVLCAVFTGLLFSCGEGIRLIPFPAADTKKNDCSRLNFENKVPYQFNAHRFEDNQGSFKTKSQRGSQNQHWIVAGGLKDTAFRFSAARVKCCFPSASGSIKSRLFVSSGESRAPPFTI